MSKIKITMKGLPAFRWEMTKNSVAVIEYYKSIEKVIIVVKNRNHAKLWSKFRNMNVNFIRTKKEWFKNNSICFLWNRSQIQKAFNDLKFKWKINITYKSKWTACIMHFLGVPMLVTFVVWVWKIISNCFYIYSITTGTILQVRKCLWA